MKEFTDDVLAAIHDQCRLADRLQIFERLLLWCAPFADCFDLGWCDFLIHLGIAILGAQPEPLEQRAAASLASRRLSEMDGEPELVGWVVGGAEDPLRFVRAGSHALATARA